MRDEIRQHRDHHGEPDNIDERDAKDWREFTNHAGASIGEGALGYEPPPAWAVAGPPILCENRAWPRARVAELVDALVSGISDGNIVGVRVPSRAPKH